MIFMLEIFVIDDLKLSCMSGVFSPTTYETSVSVRRITDILRKKYSLYGHLAKCVSP